MGTLSFLPSAEGLGGCSRCGDLCKVGSPKDPAARMLRRAEEPRGQCVNCAVAEWFYASGSRAICPDPNALREPQIQALFGQIMKASRADAALAEINWEKVIANWDLPFRVGVKKTVDPVANPEPTFPARRRPRKSRKGGAL